MTPDGRKVVLSGIRATGKMHLGNYLGVLERFARMSHDETMRCYFFIADLHTLTTFEEAQLIKDHAWDIILDILAAGVDPEKATLYVQSCVPVVTELSWYLACLTPVGELTRMATFKDQAVKHPDNVNAGLLTYPVLMAADILGPHADLVPVGQDQKPHLEYTRELVRRFNLRFGGDYFPVPDALEDEMVLVPGLAAMDDAGRLPKMGKSAAPNQTLYLREEELKEGEKRPLTNHEKILRAPTDPARVRRTDPGTPEKCAIYALHTLLSSDEEVRWCVTGCRSAGISCRDCKEVLATNFDARLAEFRERRAELAADPKRIREIIAEGNRRATQVFTETTEYVAKKMGVYRTTVQ